MMGYLQQVNEDRKKEGKNFSVAPPHTHVLLYEKYPDLYEEMRKKLFSKEF